MIDGKIRKKFKQLKYQHLKKIYEKNLSKLPSNCKYNKEIKFNNNSKLNICAFDILGDDDKVDVDLCYKPDHAQSCNAFCPRKSKEQLSQEFEEALRDDQKRATIFKDINMLYWLYPDLKFDDFPEEKSFFRRFLDLFS